MNMAVAKRAEALPAIANPVPLSGSLAYHVANPDPLPSAGKPSRMDVAEAERKLVEAEFACRPGDPVQIAMWCLRMRVLPWGPGDEKSSQDSITAIVMACAELPASVWTAGNATLALRTWKRWPTPADVYGLLSDQAKPFLRVRDGLRRVVNNGGPSAPMKRRENPTAAELEYVGGIVRALEVDLADQAGAREALAAKARVGPARPLSDGALLAAYEAAGPSGLMRAQMLRDKIARESLPASLAGQTWETETSDGAIPE